MGTSEKKKRKKRKKDRKKKKRTNLDQLLGDLLSTQCLQTADSKQSVLGTSGITCDPHDNFFRRIVQISTEGTLILLDFLFQVSESKTEEKHRERARDLCLISLSNTPTCIMALGRLSLARTVSESFFS